MAESANISDDDQDVKYFHYRRHWLLCLGPHVESKVAVDGKVSDA